MKRTLDIQKVDAALKRAAYKALHGTREQRSGRFLPAGRRGSSASRRLSKPTDVKRRKA